MIISNEKRRRREKDDAEGKEEGKKITANEKKRE